jgi:hypothetical protein
VKLFIPANRISHDIVIQGAKRTGKSVIMRQLAYQFLERGIPCVFTDPKREAIEEFYQPGDWILDPGDARCPRWAFEEEARDEMHGMAIGTSALPSEHGEQPFFKRNPRAIIARLAGVERPTTEQLSQWLVDEDEIDKRLKGTDLSRFISKDAGEMRSGMIAHLAELGRSLRFWPTGKEQQRTFSVRRWAKERKGSIFLSSTPETIDAILPAQSMLLDMLLGAAQSISNLCAFLLDEVAHYRYLPKLESAVSLQGASGNPIIMGFQEISQLKYHYGEMWPALVSQAYTQIVLRTSEEASAKHAAGLLGQAEVERIRETKSVQGWGKTTYSYAKERVRQYVVEPGQIQSLEDLNGYMAQAGRVVKFVVKYRAPVVRSPRLLPRTIKPAEIIAPSTEEPKPARSRYTQRKLKLEPPVSIT